MFQNCRAIDVALARFKWRTFHVPNSIDALGTEEERRMN